MSLDAQSREDLSTVALDLVEEFEAQGHTVDVALAANRAFGRRTGHSPSALRRDLAVVAVEESAARIGVDFRDIAGGGCELRQHDDATDRRYRLCKAKRLKRSGEIRIQHNSASAMGRPQTEEPTLFAGPRLEQWVFAYVPDTDGLIFEVLIAKVDGAVEGTPGYLLLDQISVLYTRSNGDGPDQLGFIPADEDDLFDDADEDEDGQAGVG